MRNADFGKLAIFTVWLVALFLAGVLAGEIVVGAEVKVPVGFAGTANLTASNSSVTVAVPGGSGSFALTNASQLFYVPINFSDSVGLFNVTVEANESRGCFAFINETVTNQTAYLENLIRGQLVPSQNQYEEQKQKLADLGVQCENEKTTLRNEVTDWRVQLNATRTNYESVVQRQGDELVKVRNDRHTYYVMSIVLIIVLILMLVGSAKNITIKTLWDDFANMRKSRPSVGYQQAEEVKKRDG